MSDKTSKEKRREATYLYLRLLAYIKGFPLAIFGSLIGYIVFAATTPATTWWLGFTVDAINSENFEEFRVLSPLLCLTIVIVRGIGGFCGSYSLALLANGVIHRLRVELMGHLMLLPASYFDKVTSGKLVSKFTYDIAQVTGAVSNAIAVIVREGFTVIGLLAFLIYTDWKLTLTFLLIAPVVAKVVSVASKYFRRYSMQMQESMGELTQITNESIKGHQVIKSFNAEKYVGRKLTRASEKNKIQNIKMAITRSASTPLVQFFVALALSFLVWLAMSPEFFINKSPGDFVAFLGAAGLLAKPIRQLTQINSVIQRGLSASKSVFSILDESIQADLGEKEAKGVKGKIEFRQVSFFYGRGDNAISNISFTVKAGQTVALVGKSGSGKSTIVNLIPRFYECSSGKVLIDDVDIKNFRLNSLRNQISLVTQQVMLFEGTIAENIAYFSETTNFSKITEAAKRAYAMDFIDKLPMGLETQVGDDGVLLSGGERQRIAIARALHKNSTILILDEATSALDSDSEKNIQKALNNLMAGRTTFIITHRLSTVEKADMILVLEDGKISDSGTHDQLLANNSIYNQLLSGYSEPKESESIL